MNFDIQGILINKLQADVATTPCGNTLALSSAKDGSYVALTCGSSAANATLSLGQANRAHKVLEPR